MTIRSPATYKEFRVIVSTATLDRVCIQISLAQNSHRFALVRNEQPNWYSFPIRCESPARRVTESKRS
jgi:hypothetical protein